VPSLLFIHSQTLYAKVTIPMALACLEKGWEVTFRVNRPVLFGRSVGFSEEGIKRRPTGVGVLNPDAYHFVAELIGLGNKWRAVRGRVRFSLSGAVRPRKFDAVVGTTKDMNLLFRIAGKGVPTFALGYQHLPVVARLGGPLVGHDDCADRQSVFFNDNAFAQQHRFGDIVKNCGVRLTTFTFLDTVYARRPTKVAEKDRVLIFHPGGYRDVVSTFGADEETCYAAQRAFLQRLCIPLVAKGLIPVIKVHPLRARYHDLEDLEILVRDVERKNGLAEGSIELIGPKGWFWDAAFRSAFILTFGSSSIYELWSAGLKNVYVCNFEGTARSRKFGFFSSVFLDTYDAYLAIAERSERFSPKLDSLTDQVFESYHRLFDGASTRTGCDSVSAVLG
jgi:hypothetical protein